MAKNIRKKENEVVNGVFFGLQIAGSALLLWSVFHAFFLPNIYKLIIGLLVVALALFSTFLMLKRKGRRPVKWLKNTFVTMLATTFCAVGIFIPVFDVRFREMLTPPTEGALLVDVICLNDKKFNDKAELLDGVLAVQTSFDKENQDYAIHFIQNELKGELRIQEFADFDSALAALYAGKVDFVLMNESYFNIVSENNEAFANLAEEVKIVFQVKKIIAFETIVSDANVTKKPFNILLLGQNEKKTTVSDRTNTDVIMVVTVNPSTKQVLMTSFPRDAYVSVPYSSMKDKMTHASTRGTSEMVKTVQSYLGIQIHFYIRVNYISLINLVDAVGGVTVDNPYTFRAVYSTYKNTFKEGILELDGAQALDYVRERKEACGGDMGRNEHQRIVLDALVKKVSTPSMLINFNKLMSAVEGNYLTNFTADQIYSLVKMQLNDLASWEIMQVGLKGDPANDFCASMPSKELSVVKVYEVDRLKAIENIKALMNGKKLTPEQVKLPDHPNSYFNQGKNCK